MVGKLFSFTQGFFFLPPFVCLVVYVSVCRPGSQRLCRFSVTFPVSLPGPGSLLIGQHSATGPAVFHVCLCFFFSIHTPSSCPSPLHPPLSRNVFSRISTLLVERCTASTGHRSSVHHFPKGPFVLLLFFSLGCQ